MKTNSKYFLLMLMIMSILQPGCKHNHYEEKTAKRKPLTPKTVSQIAKKL